MDGNTRIGKEGMISPRRIRAIALWLLCCITAFPAGAVEGVSLGIHVMLGARYDNLRMCVGSPAGVNGGPIADIMLDTRVHLTNSTAVGLTLPVMRPILFGLAFDMLQFEPEFILEHRIHVNDRIDMVIGPGAGASFHYGPDVDTEKDAAKRDDFFAAGPFLSFFGGLDFAGNATTRRMVGVRAFYTPLFTREHGTGTIVGAAMEGHFDFFTMP